MGYDIARFENEVKSEFVCPICHDVLEDPLSVPGCDHVYCSLCIKDWLQRTSSCPIDRIPVIAEGLQVPLRLFCNLLNELSIQCSFETCRKYVKLHQLAEHQKSCLYNPANRSKEIDCPNGCGAKIKLVDKHQCFTYLIARVRELETKVAELNQALEKSNQSRTEERCNLETLKKVFTEERGEDQKKMLIMKQEIESKSEMIDYLNQQLHSQSTLVRQVSNGGVVHSVEPPISTAILVEVDGTLPDSNQSINSRFYDATNATNGFNTLHKSPSSLSVESGSESIRVKPSKSRNLMNRIQALTPMLESTLSSASSASADKVDLNAIIRKNCKSAAVSRAMMRVNRRHFYPSNECYKIGSTKRGAHSFPFIYEIKLLEYLEPYLTSESRVLDIGSGLGFLTCCLAQMCQLVVGLEHVKELVQKAQETVGAHYQSLQVCFFRADGRFGNEKYAPYDLILIEPLVKSVFPERLFTQLKPNGSIVTVLKSESRAQLVRLSRRSDGQALREVLCDDHQWLMQNHRDALCELSNQEMARFDIINRIKNL